MNKKTLKFIIEITVDEDHPGVPEPEEIILQLERAILDDGSGSEEEFGILEAKASQVK